MDEALKTAARIGLSILEFWELTPKEFFILIDVYAKKKKQDEEEKIILTYLGAYWQRVKRMPSIKQIIKQDKPKKKMTPEEMLEEIKKINAALGGTTSKGGEAIGSS